MQTNTLTHKNMKKALFIILLFTCTITYGQTTKPQVLKQAPKDTSKAKYNYFVLVPIADYQQIAGSLTEYKRVQMYDPIPSSDQKVKLFQAIEAYLKELPTRLKIDSVKVK